jgi:hypothetical protein
MTGDILDRLRSWVYTPSLYATAEAAAEEIEKLRSDLVITRNKLRYEIARAELIESESEALREKSRIASERIAQLEAKCSVIAGIANQ